MTDLVERLRQRALARLSLKKPTPRDRSDAEIDTLAADEIERLRASAVGAGVGAETVTLEEIIAACDRHPLAVGFVHGEPSRKELQERLDTIKAIAMQAVGANVEAEEYRAEKSTDTSNG